MSLDMHPLGIFIFMFMWHANIGPVEGVTIDNGVEGEPVITCGAQEISFSVSTKKQFDGKIFVKGEYGKPECTFYNNSGAVITGLGVNEPTVLPSGTRTGATDSFFNTESPTPAHFTTAARNGQCPPCPVCDTGSQPQKSQIGQLVAPNLAKIAIQIGTCNMKRERRLNPTGVTLSVVIVVSFHPQFITKVDKSYQLRCFYVEADKSVTSVLDVSMPQTTELIAQAPMPVCSYSIRRASPDGPEIQYAKVGDTVVHKWECTSGSPAMFGMLVHSCYVDDGTGQRVQVINSAGCSSDTYVIRDLNYESSLYAYVESQVFKFADQSIIDFQCAISICVKENDGCRNTTPPTCGRRRAKREISRFFASDTTEKNHRWDLHAQRLTVVDLDDNIRSEDLALFEKKLDSSPQTPVASLSHEPHSDQESDFKSTYCLSVTAFGVLVSSCTFVLTISTALLTTLYFVRQKL